MLAFFLVKLIRKDIRILKVYIRGSFIAKAQRRTITRNFQKLYQLYYDCPLGDQDRDWAPHVPCTSCSNGLLHWMHKRKKVVSFPSSMIRQEPKNHVDDCYFCCVIVTGFSAKNKLKIVHHNINSTSEVGRPVHHHTIQIN